jgi:hypothetical protein
MTLRELLKAKDAAEAADSETLAAQREAEIVAQAAQDAHAVAVRARIDAHNAIHVRLREKGTHSLTDADGTVTTYRAVQPSEENPNGWVADHPIPGDGE